MIVTIKPRGLTTEQAAIYCGARSVEEFLSWVGRGWMPKPVLGEGTFDRLACKARFNEMQQARPMQVVPLPKPICEPPPAQSPPTLAETSKLKGINKCQAT